MQIHDLLTLQRIQCVTEPCTKKRVLELLSKLITNNQEDIDSNVILQQFIARERLGSTGIGEGVAIPHIRVPHLEKAIGAFLRLQSPIPFDSPDSKDVDLFFGLVVPEKATDEHLQCLSAIAKLFSHENCRQRMRQAQCSQALFDAIYQYESLAQP